MTHQPLRWLLGWQFLPLLFSLCLTLFIFLNSYELAFNYDLPYIGSIKPISLGHFQASLDNPQEIIQLTRNHSREGTYGRPVQLRFSSPVKRLPLAPAIRTDSTWLVWSNTGYFLFLSPPKDGRGGDLLIYLNRHWRTIRHPDQIHTGDNLFVDTDRGWRYMFRVQTIDHLQAESQYVVPDSAKPVLTVDIADPDGGSDTILGADFLSLQGIDQ